MFLRDDRLVVITGDAPKNGEIAVFSLGAILELKGQPGLLTGDPSLDLENGLTAGRVPITDREWTKVDRWSRRGDYITLTLTGQGESRRFKWGFVRKSTMDQQYLSEEQKTWLFAWIEATTDRYQEIKVAKLAEVEKKAAARAKPKPKKKKRKGRKKKHYLAEEIEWH